MWSFVPYHPHPLAEGATLLYLPNKQTTPSLLLSLSIFLLSSHDLDSSLLATLNPLSSTALTPIFSTINPKPSINATY